MAQPTQRFTSSYTAVQFCLTTSSRNPGSRSPVPHPCLIHSTDTRRSVRKRNSASSVTDSGTKNASEVILCPQDLESQGSKERQLVTTGEGNLRLEMSPTMEAMTWSENMDTLLANQAGLDAFRTFLKSEFSEENVEFWLACEDFKKTTNAEKIASKAKMIYSEFIEADAPKEINIDFSTRDLISKNIAEPTLKCFDEAQKLIYSLMAKDSFPRFLKSEIYRKLINRQQVANNKKWLPFL
ncbi:regulator of G-protein signaling 21 [Callithrix jacchus]